MKKLSFFIKQILFPACTIYTFLCLIVLIIGSASSEKSALTIPTLFLFLAISLLISLSNNIFRIKKNGLFLNSLIHMVLCVLSVVIPLVFVKFLGASYDLTMNKLVLVFLFCVLYIITVFPSLLIYTSIKKKSQKEKEYTPMFKNNNR